MEAYYPFLFGILKMTYEDDCLTGLSVINSNQEVAYKNDQHSLFSDKVFHEVISYINGDIRSFTIPFIFHGTSFQETVWKALKDIPYGQTRTYQEIANSIGLPKAARAVGNANHDNPLLLLIPCHRVVKSDGSIGGYAGGITMKKYLIDLEMNGEKNDTNKR